MCQAIPYLLAPVNNSSTVREYVLKKARMVIQGPPIPVPPRRPQSPLLYLSYKYSKNIRRQQASQYTIQSFSLGRKRQLESAIKRDISSLNKTILSRKQLVPFRPNYYAVI